MSERLERLIGQIAKEKVRLRPVPRRGVGLIIPDQDQFADDGELGSPAEIWDSKTTPKVGGPGGGGFYQKQQIINQPFPNTLVELLSTVGSGNTGRSRFTLPTIRLQ